MLMLSPFYFRGGCLAARSVLSGLLGCLRHFSDSAQDQAPVRNFVQTLPRPHTAKEKFYMTNGRKVNFWYIAYTKAKRDKK